MKGSAVYPDTNKLKFFLFSNFRHVLNVVFFLLGDSPSSVFYMPTFRNTVCSIVIGDVSRKNNRDGLLGYLYGERFGWKSSFRKACDGCGGQKPPSEGRCVGVRKGAHGMVEINYCVSSGCLSPPQPVSVLGHAPSPSPSFRLAYAIFQPNLLPCKYPNILIPVILHAYTA